MENSKYEAYKAVQPLEKSRRNLVQGKLDVSARQVTGVDSMNSSLLGLTDRVSGANPRRPVQPQSVEQAAGESTLLSLSDVDSPSPDHTHQQPPSPMEEDGLVKVTRHRYDDEVFDTDPASIVPAGMPPSDEWRRFTSNFVSPDNQPTEQNTDKVITESAITNVTPKPGGIGRSQSDHVMEKPRQERPVLSQSVDHGRANKKPPRGRTVASRYLSESNRKPPPSRAKATPSSKPAPVKTGLTTGKKVKPGAKFKGQRENQRFRPSTVGKPPPSVAKAMQSTPSHSRHSVSFSPSALTTSTPLHRHGDDRSFLSEAGKSSSPQEIEYLYCRLLQATALNTLSAESIRTQDQLAKGQLFRLWSAVEGKREESHQLRLALEKEQHELALDKTLAVQQQALGPLVSTLPVLEKNYRAMAEAVDTTRHYMTMQGISPINEGELSEQLAESEVLLGDIMAVIRPEAEHVSLFAESAHNVADSLKREQEELINCSELLEAVTKLQLHEASLSLGQSQSSTASH